MSFRIPNPDNSVEVRQAFQAIQQILSDIESRMVDVICFRCGVAVGNSTIAITFTKTGLAMWRVSNNSTYANGASNSMTVTAQPSGILNLTFYAKDGSSGITKLVANNSMLTWTVPDVANCVNMTHVDLNTNSLDNYPTGTLSNLTRLIDLNLSVNALPVGVINNILSDLLINQRRRRNNEPVCTVDLSGGTNAVPTGLGLTAKAALIAAGWTVTTN